MADEWLNELVRRNRLIMQGLDHVWGKEKMLVGLLRLLRVSS